MFQKLALMKLHALKYVASLSQASLILSSEIVLAPLERVYYPQNPSVTEVRKRVLCIFSDTYRKKKSSCDPETEPWSAQ